ncbi:unnamed protein product [Allacma fusca]|uniref:Phosphoglycerate mutase n=1 Tax=Allacma fusca TaxID=39272 RepID=A0A8J2KMC3_9HEXA|nr:unnamed protein product [Allacma fusca]
MSLIYFVRHGESIGNTQLKNLTPDENVLSETGVLQAKQLGAHLKNVVFTHVFSSPYIRAISTAQHILSESKTLYRDDVIVGDSDIRERYLGIYEQKSTKELAHAFKSTGVDFDWTPEGGETRHEVELRIESFLQRVGNIVDTGSERKTILVVTHAALMIHLWCYLLERKEKYKLTNWKSDFLKVSKNTNYFLLAVEKLEGTAQPRPVPFRMVFLIIHSNCVFVYCKISFRINSLAIPFKHAAFTDPYDRSNWAGTSTKTRKIGNFDGRRI